MITLRRFLAIMSITLLVSLFLTACGTAQTPPTATTATNANTTNTSTNYQMTPAPPTTPTAKATMGMQPTPTATGAMTGDNGNKQAFIQTAFVTLSGKRSTYSQTIKGSYCITI